jgi:hypothetical protein
MAYSPEAVAKRRCTGTRKDGQPCRAWAMWGHPRQLCAQHGGRGHRGPMPNPPAWQTKGLARARYEPCRCEAYAWPHRPGGGLCRWPEAPAKRSSVPAGKRSFGAQMRRARKVRVR